MAALLQIGNDEESSVFVYDRRLSNVPELKINKNGLLTYLDFKSRICSILDISESEQFVITTTNREEINNDALWDLVDKGDTLYVLKSLSQELCAPAEERITYLPHYDTIVKGGMYEYYASEGQNPLPYALAELIDNSLAATSHNTSSTRDIEVRLHLDLETPQKNCVIVIDNGKGMSPHQLSNWATYRLSKFTRHEKSFKGTYQAVSGPSNNTNAHELFVHYMNSDISYFGVGGKQAIFFIGNATRMISKPKDSMDVHELEISKDDFERKERSNQSIYSGFIYNRKPGDASHISSEDEITGRLIAEEGSLESFTAVVINGISPAHVPYLKQHFSAWTRQLAHIYHFYLHGPDGNVLPENRTLLSSLVENINIKVRMVQRGQACNKLIELHSIEDDMQTLFARSSVSMFEFKAVVDGSSAVEGMLRYHPFLFDRETFPSDLYDPRLDQEPEDDHGYAINDQRARGKRAIFECYWNGRLIPYTLIDSFDWCAFPKKNRTLPLECYNRISGVLWTNDTFQVSTNKLTFLDLELKLRDKNTAFMRVVNGHDKRTAIDKEFTLWLKECHEKFDKQILFSGFKGVKCRTELPRHRQHPWSVYTQVEWDGCTFAEGQMVKINRSSAPLYGSVQCFLLNGEYDGDVFSTGGEVEILQEPLAMYDERRTVPLSKIDRFASQVTIKYYIEEEMSKLPDHLVVSWPNGMEVLELEKRPAGKTVGDIKVEISNRKGEVVSKMPGVAAKKLLVELKVIWHSVHGDEEIVSHLSQHGKNWPYWFRKMENMKNIGRHTIHLQTVLNESGADVYAGQRLPSHCIKFTIIEGEADCFTVGLLDGPFKVGHPFNIPLEFLDKYRNPTKPPNNVKPCLSAEELELSFGGLQVKPSCLLIMDVIAKGMIPTHSGKNFNLLISVNDIQHSHTLRIRLMSGPPSSLVVHPKDELTVENGTSVHYSVTVYDLVGNATGDGRQVINLWFPGEPSIAISTVNTNNMGAATVSSCPIRLSKLTSPSTITCRFELQGQRGVDAVERRVTVLPTSHVCFLQIFRSTDCQLDMRVCNDDQIKCIVGEVMTGLKFKLLDEAEREIEIDEGIASRIMVNWVPKICTDLLLRGSLPDITVPTSVREVKYCHVSMNGFDIHCSFSVRGESDQVSQLLCKPSGSVQVSAGEVMSATITVQAADCFGNLVKFNETDVRELKVSAEGLIENLLKIHQVDDDSLLVENIKLDTGHIGVHRLTIRYRDLEETIPCEVMSAPPTSLDMPDWSPEMPVTVYSDNQLPFPVSIQLMDALSQPCRVAGVCVYLTKAAKIKIFPVPQPVKTDAEGIANFGILSVSGPMGVYTFQANATYGRSVLCGPKIKVSIQLDPMKPKKLQVKHSAMQQIAACDEMPEFVVKVIAEDDSTLNTQEVAHLSMKIWKVDNVRQSHLPSNAISVSPDIPDQSFAGVFTFSNIEAPSVVGRYNIMFVYIDEKTEISSSVVSISVKANAPAKLIPLEPHGVPTVSNTHSTSCRCIVRFLKLQLQDRHGNHFSNGLSGEVVVTVVGPKDEPDVPLLAGSEQSLTVHMRNGQVTLQQVSIQENSPGKDGVEYWLRCCLTSSKSDHHLPDIPPLDLPFLFYNDARKQSKMAILSKERDRLQHSIEAYQSMFMTHKKLVDALKLTVSEAGKLRETLQEELLKQNISKSQIQPMGALTKLIVQRLGERDQLVNTPRRVCGLPVTPSEAQVLGKIGHLAMIADADIARVISWHMLADMDCIITFTTKKAQEIYSRTQGRQQVLPLDSIFRKNLPDWGKPLPHLRHLPDWKPCGQPVYARDLLNFPLEKESCQLVFGMLLGDTLILDNLDNANIYRQEGDRIRSNGKFGGTMNRAVPVEKLRGALFGEPLPMAYHALCTQISSLEQYKLAWQRLLDAKDELDNVVEIERGPDMSAKLKECHQAENELQSVEGQLGFSRSSGRGNQGSNNAVSPSTKRRRLSPIIPHSPSSQLSASLDGDQWVANGKPTRTSLRVRHQAVSDENVGKKVKTA